MMNFTSVLSNEAIQVLEPHGGFAADRHLELSSTKMTKIV